MLNADLYAHDWTSTFSNSSRADDYWNAFISVLNSYLDVHCPLFSNRSKFHKPFVYPASIRRLAAEKIEVWRLLKSANTNTLLRAKYDSISTLYRNAVNKFHYARESAVLNSGNVSDFYKYVRRSLLKTNAIPPILDPSGTLISDPSTKANLFNDYFSSVFTTDDGILNHFPLRSDSPHYSLNSIDFSSDLVLPKLLKLKKSYSLNPDTFPPILLQSCASSLSTPLSYLYNSFFSLSQLPSPWLTAIVLPLFKKGKHNLSSNYRPISLTSSCCKIMESLLSDLISDYLLSHNLLHVNQHGFQKNRSTLSNLLTSTHHWYSSLNSRKSTDVIYIDFAKAFDSVSHPKLLLKLRSYGISGSLLNFISSWLTGRSQSVLIEGVLSYSLAVVSGVLQGSVLGPLLFLIFINDIIDNLPPSAHPLLFADDLKLYSDEITIPCSSSPCSFFSPILQYSLNEISKWSSKWQLPISRSKCSVLCISRSKNCPPRSYTISSSIIPQVSSSVDLGVIIDDKLSFSAHISSLVKKAYSRSILISRCFLSKNCTLLSKAFTTYVRPLAEYCTQIWSPHYLKYINLIENIQRRFSKHIPILKDLSYPARLTKLALPSLELRRRQFDLITCYRVTHSWFHTSSYSFFTPRSHNITRGHAFMLAPPAFAHSSCFKFSFFSRVISDWNSLPATIVSACSVSAFKSRIRLHSFS